MSALEDQLALPQFAIKFVEMDNIKLLIPKAVTMGILIMEMVAQVLALGKLATSVLK